MSFAAAAGLLLPPETAGGGEILRADERWEFDRSAAGERPLVWGREPTYSRAGPWLVGAAAARERRLRSLRRRPPGRLVVVGVHRWPPAFYRPRALSGAVQRLRSGLLVELADPDRPLRVVDLAARAAGAPGRLGSFHLGSGGAAVVRLGEGESSRRILRVALEGSAADPRRAAEALERLASLGLSCVPRPLGTGRVGSANWSLESALAGRTPAGLGEELAPAVGRFCLRLPRESRPPTAFSADAETLAERLPDFAAELQDLRARAEPAINSLPSVLGHGDLWAGNLLTERNELTGVLDWDAWTPRAVPGTDLLHLIAAAQALKSPQSFAEILLARPWQAPSFRAAAAPYWRGLGLRPDEPVLHAVGLAWWLSQTAQDLVRNPHHAEEEDWVARNMAPLLADGRWEHWLSGDEA